MDMIKIVGAVLAAVGVQVAFGLGTGDYARRGLVAHWDAIDNVGTGEHDSAATVWKDLSGNDIDWVLTAGTSEWTDRGLKMLGTAGQRVGELSQNGCTNFLNKVTTVEFVWAQGVNADSYILATGFNYDSAAGLVWMAKDGGQLGVFNPQSGTRSGFKVALGTTNAFHVTYTRTGTMPSGVSSLRLNGQSYTSHTMTDWYPGGQKVPVLGGRYGSTILPPTGTLLALRIYDCELTETEKALNYALDRVRLFGDDPQAVTLPAGYHFLADGTLEKLAYCWTGNGGSSDWATAANWSFEGRADAAPSAPGAGDEAVVTAAVNVPACRIDALKKLTLGTGGSLVLAAGATLVAQEATCGGASVGYGLYTGDGAKGKRVVWLGGSGTLAVGDFAGQSQQYTRRGLVAQWDALDRSDTGTQTDCRLFKWKDLSGNGYDWQLDPLGQGYVFDDRALVLDGTRVVARMPSKSFAGKCTTVEIVWSGDAARDSVIFDLGLRYVGANNQHVMVFTLKQSGVVANDALSFWGTDAYYSYGIYNAIGTTNVLQTVYTFDTASPEKPNGVKSIAENGRSVEVLKIKDYYGSVSSIPSLGGRIRPTGDSNFLPSKGRLMALRVYDCELTEMEAANNAALDRVRFCGEDPVLAAPEGYMFSAEGKLVACGLAWTGAAGDGKWSTPGNWQYENGRTAGVPPNAGMSVSVPAAVAITVDGDAACASLALGAGATLTVAEGVRLDVGPFKYDGVDVAFGGYSGTAARGRRAAWAAGAGYVCVFSNVAATSDAYVRDGLVAQWDGVDNTGLGAHDAAHTGWADLSGNGYDWTFGSGGWKWNGTSLKMSGTDIIGTMPGKDTTAFYGKLTTLECTLSLDVNHEGVVFVPGFGSTTYVATSKKNDLMLGFYLPKSGQSAYYDIAPGDTNVFQVTYVRTQDIPTGVASTLLNGELGAVDTTLDAYTINGGPTLGARPNDTPYGAKGSLFSLRLYNRELSATEFKLNRALDRVRLLRENPALVDLPAGYRFDADGRIGPMTYVWTGDAGDGQWSTVGNWQLDDGTSATTVPPAGAPVDLTAATAVSVSGLGNLTLKSIAFGASTVLTLASDTRLAVGTVTVAGENVSAACYSAQNARATVAGWLGGAGVVSVAGDGSANYPELPPVQDGTTLVFDVPAGVYETWSAEIGSAVTAVVKTGAGELRLAGDNGEFAGTVAVNAGTLTAESTAAFGGASAVVTVANGAMVAAGALSSADAVTAQVVIVGAGADGRGVLRTSDRCNSGGFANVALAGDATVCGERSGGIVGGVLDLRGNRLTVNAPSQADYFIKDTLVTNTLSVTGPVGSICYASGAALSVAGSVFAGGAENMLEVGPGSLLLKLDGVTSAWTLKGAQEFTTTAVGDGAWGGPVEMGYIVELTNSVPGGATLTFDGGFANTGRVIKADYGLTTYGDADFISGGVYILGGGLRFRAHDRQMIFGRKDGGNIGSAGPASFDYFNPGGTAQVLNATYPGMGAAAVYRFRGGDVTFDGGTIQPGKIDLGRGAGNFIVSGGTVTTRDFHECLSAKCYGYTAVAVDGADAVLRATSYFRQYATNTVASPHCGYLSLARGGTLATPRLHQREGVDHIGASRFMVNADGGVLKMLGSGGIASVGATYPSQEWNEDMTLTVHAGGLTLDTSEATGAIQVEGPLLRPADGKRLVGVKLPTTSAFLSNRYTYLRPVAITTSTGSGAYAYIEVDDDTLIVTNVTIACGGAGYADSDTVHLLVGGTSSVGNFHTLTAIWADAATAAESKGFTKRGEKDAELLNANTYLGPTTVESGLLRFTHANSLPSGSALVVGQTGTADLGGHDFTVPTVKGLGVVTNGNLSVTAGVSLTADEFAVRQGLRVKGRVTFADGAQLTLADPENVPANARTHTVISADELVGELTFDTSVLPGDPSDWRFYRSGNSYRLGRNIGLTVIVR